MSKQAPFWESKTLFEMTPEEWESVCDGCAKCCLAQLQDEDSGQLVFTDVACDLLDAGTCRCTDYAHRSQRVPTCMTLDAENVMEAAEFAPPSCAYRLLLEGKPLPDWHHLVSGSREDVHKAGCSVQHKVRFEREIKDRDIEDFVVDWPLYGADSDA